jgi:hypothetical protein
MYCENKKSGCGGSIPVVNIRNCVVEAHFFAVALRNCSGATQFPLWPVRNRSGAAQIPLWTSEIAQGRVIFRCEHEISRCGGSNRIVGNKNRVGAGQKSLGRVKSPRGGSNPTGALKVSNLQITAQGCPNN